ncbi:Delta(12)-fatty-acid desaturase [Acaryochloris thomasi RCC1774]|uniref:Delta(12)-fatty-acid desaturase n=1 Tax=Acaryochloris thomasi RCC1774 TaxID=1764569 RepID=A0A2W1JRA2_9CYAN|nr:fatty acid desaturase [Acaryochloris thomasi]PZD72594.1 Delta(12)-fatty-acid desaturase [Acaryochloris thomasi RCC1774]
MVSEVFQPPSPAAVPVANPRQILATRDLAALNERSNLEGSVRLTAHLAIIGLSGYLWGTGSTWLALPSLFLYGISLAFMFCAMHECAHRTAFANAKLNDGAAWFAGLLSFYNSTFYRRYHKWHHRYTRIAGKDPELGDLEPENVLQYLWQLSGIPWWQGKIVGHLKTAFGQLDNCYFLPEATHAEVIRSTRLQLGIGVAIALISTTLGHPWFLAKYWLLPLAVGQPFLRFILLAEHTGCSSDDNPLTNTRTTLTLSPLQLLMWNMSYHTEHHLYPSIPFHRLPKAHQQLKTHFAHIEPGYLNVNQKIVAAFK